MIIIVYCFRKTIQADFEKKNNAVTLNNKDSKFKWNLNF